jgi:hypothetical protein
MRRSTIALALLAALTFAGCEASKSSNPTSPSVAGPIPGVTITTPKLLEPGANWNITSSEQPITLLIENASSNGQRPVTYAFEVAADVEFATKLFNQEGVAPGGNGRTSIRLPDALASDRTYYWRARATDGANASAFTPAQAFSVVTAARIDPPVPASPIGGVQISSTRPQFVARAGGRSGPVGGVAYTFEISRNESFTAMVAVVTIPETPVETRFTLAQELAYSTRFFWRVRAYDPQTASNWSNTQSFVTPVQPPTAPPPTEPPPGPGPTGWPKNGPELVVYTEKKYPERLRAGVSLSERQTNMAFLRDRMIEAGICGGMELAWNLKRGGPDRSIDYLTWKKNGTWVGVDIGLAYDDTSIPLRLQWGDGDTYLIFPDPYSPRPTCK